jgi:hypothetical protein
MTNLFSKFCSIRNVADRKGYLGNALHINWSNMTPIMYPPISLINRVLEKFLKERELGVIILLDWWN